MPVKAFDLNVINDDEADLNLWAINPSSGLEEYSVKFLAFYSNEGETKAYSIRLETQPTADVTITPKIYLVITIMFPGPISYCNVSRITLFRSKYME